MCGGPFGPPFGRSPHRLGDERTVGRWTPDRPVRNPGNEARVLWANGLGHPTMGTMDDKMEGTCPVCHQGDLIGISMSVSGSDLGFTTCHMCEAKWWHRDGEAVPLQNVIGKVLAQKV